MDSTANCTNTSHMQLCNLPPHSGLSCQTGGLTLQPQAHTALLNVKRVMQLIPGQLCTHVSSKCSCAAVTCCLSTRKGLTELILGVFALLVLLQDLLCCIAHEPARKVARASIHVGICLQSSQLLHQSGWRASQVYLRLPADLADD
jgi:hypothetical protein